MQNRKRDTDVQNRLLDSVGEGEGGIFERTALKHVYYLGWYRSPAQVGCMRQVLGPGALGRPRGIGQRGRWEGGSGWGKHVNPWLIRVNVLQNPLQYCRVIGLQLIKINENKKKKERKRKQCWLWVPESNGLSFQEITESFCPAFSKSAPQPVSQRPH